MSSIVLVSNCIVWRSLSKNKSIGFQNKSIPRLKRYSQISPGRHISTVARYIPSYRPALLQTLTHTHVTRCQHYCTHARTHTHTHTHYCTHYCTHSHNKGRGEERREAHQLYMTVITTNYRRPFFIRSTAENKRLSLPVFLRVRCTPT